MSCTDNHFSHAHRDYREGQSADHASRDSQERPKQSAGQCWALSDDRVGRPRPMAFFGGLAAATIAVLPSSAPTQQDDCHGNETMAIMDRHDALSPSTRNPSTACRPASCPSVTDWRLPSRRCLWTTGKPLRPTGSRALSRPGQSRRDGKAKRTGPRRLRQSE